MVLVFVLLIFSLSEIPVGIQSAKKILKFEHTNSICVFSPSPEDGHIQQGHDEQEDGAKQEPSQVC